MFEVLTFILQYFFFFFTYTHFHPIQVLCGQYSSKIMSQQQKVIKREFFNFECQDEIRNLMFQWMPARTNASKNQTFQFPHDAFEMHKCLEFGPNLKGERR